MSVDPSNVVVLCTRHKLVAPAAQKGYPDSIVLLRHHRKRGAVLQCYCVTSEAPNMAKVTSVLHLIHPRRPQESQVLVPDNQTRDITALAALSEGMKRANKVAIVRLVPRVNAKLALWQMIPAGMQPNDGSGRVLPKAVVAFYLAGLPFEDDIR